MKIRICLCLTTLLAACSTPLQSPEVTVADITDTPGIEEISDVILSPDVTPDPDQETTFPDLVPDELQPDTAVPGCEPGMGCFLDGCDDNSNCQSGWCVQHLGEGVCSQICQEDCPPGWSCQQVAGTDPDVIYICVSDFANLCRPCAGGDDCTSTGGAEDACLDYGLEGSFCGGPCDTDKDCPWGFSCAETVTVDGADIQQCMADTGLCPCTQRSADLALWTPCEISNDSGTCAGQRICSDSGLSDCDAGIPQPEGCNGSDDDCDGESDEPTLFEGTYVELCDDGNDCTDDACLGEEGCVNTILESGSCDDEDPCTIADHCEAGECFGKPVDCDDANPCTDDSCTFDGGCVNEPNLNDCDDTDPCTVADECLDGVCSGYFVGCECHETSDCEELEDDDICNGTLICDTSSLPHLCAIDQATLIICPQPEGIDAPCLTPSCDGTTGQCSLLAANDAAACDSGNACTVKDTCLNGLCTPGNPVNCNDGNPCTDDSCDPESGCVNTANQAPCSDTDVCTTIDICSEGQCSGGPALLCNDGNACNGLETCSGDSGCISGIPLDCDDLDPCNGTETCAPDTGCVSNPAPVCDDSNLCTDDSCIQNIGCKYDYNQAQCDDGNACTSGDICQNGTCGYTGGLACDDGNLCTDNECDPNTGCIYTVNIVPCDDQDMCTTKDRCQLGACVGSQSLPCNDGNPCTDDSCSALAGCQFIPNALNCDDGNACTEADICDNGICFGALLTCDDNNVCTDDSCDSEQGCVFSPLADGSQVPGCNQLCHSCESGTCSNSPAQTDPGDDCDPHEEFQTGGEPHYCQKRIQPGTCDSDGECAPFGLWEPVNAGLQCSALPICIADRQYSTTACSDDGTCTEGLGEIGCCGDSVCDDNKHCDLDTNQCVNNYPACQGWEYNGYCWYYDDSDSYEYSCTELCQAHGAECLVEGRLQEAVNSECTVCRHWFPALTCSFANHDEPAKPCTYGTSKCEYANYSPAVSSCDGPKYGTATHRFCSCTF